MGKEKCNREFGKKSDYIFEIENPISKGMI
jgi:hypothetical protein